MDKEPQWACFFHPRLSLRLHYLVGFGKAFTKLPRAGGYRYAVILDDNLRIVAPPLRWLNIPEKPVFSSGSIWN